MPRVRRTLNKKLFRRSPGFSLIIVLIIFVVGFSIVAVTLQMTIMSAGGGRVVAAGNDKYNLLQGAVEEGKAILKKAMDNTLPIPRYFDPSKVPPIFETDRITKVDDLLLTDTHPTLDFRLGNAVTRDLGRNELGRLGIVGSRGFLSVKIYDMQYPPNNIADIGNYQDQITREEYNMLPPSVILSAASNPNWGGGGESQDTEIQPGGFTGSTNNAGIYLVRATLTAGEGDAERKWVLDSVIIQANNETESGT